MLLRDMISFTPLVSVQNSAIDQLMSVSENLTLNVTPLSEARIGSRLDGHSHRQHIPISVQNPASIHHCIRQAFANQTGRDTLSHINRHYDTFARLSDEYGLRWRSAFEREFSNSEQSHIFGRLCRERTTKRPRRGDCENRVLLHRDECLIADEREPRHFLDVELSNLRRRDGPAEVPPLVRAGLPNVQVRIVTESH
jgi:hypothetical protein